MIKAVLLLGIVNSKVFFYIFFDKSSHLRDLLNR